MKRIMGILGLTLFAIGIASVAMLSNVQAESLELTPFIALLTGGQEVPANQSNAFGVAFMTFNEETKMLNFSLTYTDEKLTGAEISAHFHAPAVPGVNAGVVFGLVNPGPFNLGSPKVGSVGPFDLQQEAYLKDGLFYINVHTSTIPTGEIRGQVLPAGNGIDFDVKLEG